MFQSKDVNVKILSAHKMTWGKQNKYAYPRPFHALSLRLYGEANFTHGDKVFKVNKEDLIFVPKNYDYTINSLKEESVIVVHFDADIEFNSIETFTPKQSEIFISLFTAIENAYRLKYIGYKHKIHSLFYQILEHAQIQGVSESYYKTDLMDSFEKSVNYLKTNYTDPDVTISILAKISNVSETYYRKIFSRKYNTSPLKYINNLRLSLAVTMLKTGYYSVEQVAVQCGFSDPKYFATCYKKQYGHSPGKDIPKIFKNI